MSVTVISQVMVIETAMRVKRGTTDRARRTHVLDKLLPRLESFQGTRSCAIVGEGLNINSG
jgi:hypothetical protein